MAIKMPPLEILIFGDDRFFWVLCCTSLLHLWSKTSGYHTQKEPATIHKIQHCIRITAIHKTVKGFIAESLLYVRQSKVSEKKKKKKTRTKNNIFDFSSSLEIRAKSSLEPAAALDQLCWFCAPITCILVKPPWNGVDASTALFCYEPQIVLWSNICLSPLF